MLCAFVCCFLLLLLLLLLCFVAFHPSIYLFLYFSLSLSLSLLLVALTLNINVANRHSLTKNIVASHSTTIRVLFLALFFFWLHYTKYSQWQRARHNDNTISSGRRTTSNYASIDERETRATSTRQLKSLNELRKRERETSRSYPSSSQLPTTEKEEKREEKRRQDKRAK